MKENKKEAAFIAIYAKDFQPWLKVKDIEEESKVKKVNLVLMLNRWDGYTGFPGGLIEQGENSITGAIRETFEEIDYEILNLTSLKHITTNKLSETTVHLYAIEVSVREIFNIQKNLTNAVDYGSEIMGSNLVILNDLKNGKGFNTFKNTPMPEKVQEDLEKLRKFI